MISKATNTNDNYLRAEELTVGTEYNKVAYLSGFKTGINKLDRGYYTLYFKDANGTMVLGNWNNINDFINSGKAINDMKKRPVKIQFEATEFNGSIALNIIQLESYDPVGFPYDKFVGIVNNVDDSLMAVNLILGKTLGENTSVDERYKEISLTPICEGKCGGYAKLLELVAYDLVTYQSVSNISLKVLIGVFFEVQKGYFNYLLAKEKADIVSKSDLIDILQITNLENKDNEYLPIIIDCLSALIGLTNNIENMYAIIITNAFKNKIENLNLIAVYNTMVLGAEKNWGKYKLLKY